VAADARTQKRKIIVASKAALETGLPSKALMVSPGPRMAAATSVVAIVLASDIPLAIPLAMVMMSGSTPQ